MAVFIVRAQKNDSAHKQKLQKASGLTSLVSGIIFFGCWNLMTKIQASDGILLLLIGIIAAMIGAFALSAFFLFILLKLKKD